MKHPPEKRAIRQCAALAARLMEYTLGLNSPFSLEYTLESGQVFRWGRKGQWWYGIVSGGVLKVRQEGDSLRCHSSSDFLDSAFVGSYFRLDDDLQTVLVSVMKDETMKQAVQKFYGMRLIAQDFWECLASFVLATNSNIPRIRKMVSSVCARFGDPLEFEGAEYFRFPGPETLADAPVEELRDCGLGYRAPYLKRVADSVTRHRIDSGELSLMGYDQARKTLLKELLGEKILLGVGPKVADCVLLYSCGFDEAFPIDVWIARVLADSYPKLLAPGLKRRLSRASGAKLGRGDYDRVSSAARSYFGRYAGYAQQYLFVMSRELG